MNTKSIITSKSFFRKKTMSHFCSRLLVLCLLLLCTSQLSLSANTQKHCKDLTKLANEEFYNRNYAKSLELLMEAKTMAENNNWNTERSDILNLMGMNYMEMTDYGEALRCFLEAYQIALEKLVPNPDRWEMVSLNNIAILYSKEKEFDKAEEYFTKAYLNANRTKDSSLIVAHAINLAWIANETGKPNAADKYINEALSILKERPNTYHYICASIVKIRNLSLKSEYNMAQELAFELLSTYNEHDGKYDNEKIGTLYLLSIIFQKKGDIDKAIDYAEQALKIYPTLEDRIDLYELFSELYLEKKLFNKAILYKDSLMLAKDSLNSTKNQRFFESNQIRFELQNSQIELSENKAKQKTERLIYIFTIVFIIVLSTILIWALRINFVKEKQRKKIAELELEREKKDKLLLESDKLLLEKQLQEQETIALLEQERLKNEIDRKNKELIVNAMFLSTRNDLIEHIVNSLTKSPEVSNNKVLLSNIHELKKQLKENSEWDGFLAHFETINSGFLEKIKERHPNLTVNEIRFLSYIYINLNTKEIASLLNITPEACRKRKQFIATKRLDLTSSSLLYSYLSSL